MPAIEARRLLDPEATAAIVLGAHDWTEAGLSRAPSFLRSARGVVAYLYDSKGLSLDPTLVIDLFDDTASAGEQLARVRDELDLLLRDRQERRRPVKDVLLYYVGHGYTDDQNHLSLMVRRSRRGMEAETGIKALDLARVLKVAAPQQRRLIILDCCFSEAAAKDFIGQSGSLDRAVAATAAKDFAAEQPRRGTLLLCSSPVGEVSIGRPQAETTLFTGSVIRVLRDGAEGRPPTLSFADLRDASYEHMLVEFGANAPRPILHQVNSAGGDLTREPAFPNRAPISVLPAEVAKSAGSASPNFLSQIESEPASSQVEPSGGTAIQQDRFGRPRWMLLLFGAFFAAGLMTFLAVVTGGGWIGSGTRSPEIAQKKPDSVSEQPATTPAVKPPPTPVDDGQVSQLRDQLAKLTDELGRVQEQSKEKDSDIANLGRKLNDALSSVSSTTEKFDIVKQGLEKVEQQNKEKDNQIATLAQKLNSALAQRVEERAAFDNKSKIKDEKVAKLNQDLSAALARLKALEQSGNGNPRKGGSIPAFCSDPQVTNPYLRAECP